jgi:RNA polymerase sigma-70 factor (ECF subfamily)
MRTAVQRSADRPAGDAGGDRLASALRAGDPTAFEELVEIHGPRMLAVARRFMRNEEDARDALQDALLRVLQSIDGFSNRSRLSTWLHRVVVNSCLMRLRARRRRPEVPMADLPPPRWQSASADRSSWDPTESILRRQQRRLLRKSIDKLPEHYRTVLVLRVFEERDTRETASLLSTSRNAVKIRLHRAHRAVAELVWQHQSASGASQSQPPPA